MTRAWNLLDPSAEPKLPRAARRVPYALRPRIQQLDAIVRGQQAEIERLRVAVGLAAAGRDGFETGDISFKVATLLRVMRLRHLNLNSPLARAAQTVGLMVDWLLERERDRLVETAGRAPRGLEQLLQLDPYEVWRKTVEPGLASGVPTPEQGPLISIVLPVYKVTPAILRATLESLRRQTYRRWEACIAFADPDASATLRLVEQYARRDPRFRLQVLERNLGISGNSNAALAMARGDYIGLLDHDDELTPPALARIVAALRAEPEADFLYTDKDLIPETGRRRFQPLFKPEWSPETLYSVNYLTHFNVIRADLIRAVGGWARGVDGAQDWDLFLRTTEQARKIVRVPGVAYSWRVHQASTASGIDAKPYALAAQHRALAAHAERIGLPGAFRPHSETGFAIAWNEVPPVRLVILGAREGGDLPLLLDTLTRDRSEFTEVDLLLPPRDAWRFLSTWRAGKGELPSWCSVHPMVGVDPIGVCGDLLRRALETVTVFIDGGILVHTPSALRQLAGWFYPASPIAFASAVTVETDECVIEAGCVVDEAGVAHPLFRDAPLRRWGVIGGPLWHRNVDVASPYFLALRTADAAAALSEHTARPWQTTFHEICASLTDGGRRRGVVDPSARAMLAPGCAFPSPAEGMIGDGGPHLHPYLTVDPRRGVSFRAAHAA